MSVLRIVSYAGCIMGGMILGYKGRPVLEKARTKRDEIETIKNKLLAEQVKSGEGLDVRTAEKEAKALWREMNQAKEGPVKGLFSRVRDVCLNFSKEKEEKGRKLTEEELRELKEAISGKLAEIEE